MGCRNAKVENDPRVGNGNSKVGTTNGDSATIREKVFGVEAVGAPTVVDPRCPLDSRQIFKLKGSWKGIKRRMEDTGLEMFVRLFKVDAGLKNMFQALKHLESDDEMRSDEALESHATMVMTTLDDAITHIDNFDYVSEVLRKTGASHVRFDGFKTENFFKIREPFLEAVKITLGDRYTENMESIYKIAITFILQTMAEGMQDAINEESVDGDGS